jgi:hypothetical protein
MSPGPIPPNPLRRYLELAGALRQSKRWFEDWTIPRFSVLALLTSDGGANELVGRMRETSKRIEKRAGLFGPMNSGERHLVAAMLVRDGEDPDTFSDEVAQVRKLFRERKVRRGSMSEVLAILILRTQSPRRQVNATQVTRFQAIYKALLADHYWLTGVEDYPTCALLCGSTQPPEAIRKGVESLYQELHARRFRRGNALQTATHVLFLTPDGPQAGATRFESLWRAFREAGLRMVTEDYEEVAPSRPAGGRQGRRAHGPLPPRIDPGAAPETRAIAVVRARREHGVSRARARSAGRPAHRRRQDDGRRAADPEDASRGSRGRGELIPRTDQRSFSTSQGSILSAIARAYASFAKTVPCT